MSLFAKLRFQPSAPVYVLGDSAAFLLRPEAPYKVLNILPVEDEPGVQQAILFARSAGHLERDFSALAPKLAEGAVLWIAYPKKSGSIKSDLTRDKGWEIVSEKGYVGVSQVSLDAEWSALWFKKPDAVRSFKRAIPLEQRTAEGIDYKARTVTLPADAAAALEEHAGLHDFFNALSFSHKREWAEAIAEARKPETRARRIAKMAGQLAQQKEERAAKTAAKKSS